MSPYRTSPSWKPLVRYSRSQMWKTDVSSPWARSPSDRLRSYFACMSSVQSNRQSAPFAHHSLCVPPSPSIIRMFGAWRARIARDWSDSA